MLKRQENLTFGGYYAFPGGKVERQDHIEAYESAMPAFSEAGHYHDFKKRAEEIHEKFEECNVLLATKSDLSRTVYLNQYPDKFPSFLRDHGATPDIGRLMAFGRLGTPIGLPATQDTQFYLCFLDPNEQRSLKIEMNPKEFVDYKWLTVKDALDKFSQDKLPLFVPQVHILAQLYLYNYTFSELRKHSTSWQTRMWSYLTNKGHMVQIQDLATD